MQYSIQSAFDHIAQMMGSKEKSTYDSVHQDEGDLEEERHRSDPSSLAKQQSRAVHKNIMLLVAFVLIAAISLLSFKAGRAYSDDQACIELSTSWCE